MYPTDTLYGLGVDALDEAAIRKVFELKRRPLSMPLPIAVNGLKMLKKFAFVDEKAESFIGEFLPGPLTVILKKRLLSDILTSGSEKVGVRIPDNDIALRLISQCGAPITTTSANISGRSPPISVEEVKEQMGGVNLILDGGDLESRLPSTIVDLTDEPKIVREGKLAKEIIEKFLEKVYG
ncbi:MAG: L-threonylcarbamoyladenylate synthase [Candidatus Hydrothermarchaeales archaeon]